MRTGRDAEAADLLREVLAIAPRHADSHLDLALLLRERGNLQGAIDHLREARSILPERATYAMALGTTLAMAGRSREALDELRFAVGSRPSWERAHANLAAVAYQNGLRDDALLHGRTALALGGREPVTRRVASALGLAAARD